MDIDLLNGTSIDEWWYIFMKARRRDPLHVLHVHVDVTDLFAFWYGNDVEKK